MSEDRPLVLTPWGRRVMEEELHELQTRRRPAVAEQMRESRAHGDTAESADFEVAKAEQAMVEERIQELRQILNTANVLTLDEIPTDYVGLGSSVTLRDLDADEDWEMTLVSSFEADPLEDLISVESPMGQALLNKKPGEQVAVQAPAGPLHYEVVSISRRTE